MSAVNLYQKSRTAIIGAGRVGRRGHQAGNPTMSDRAPSVTNLTAKCVDCGGEYPVGGRVGRDDSPEGPEHHEEDCPVRRAFINSGRWERPDTASTGINRGDVSGDE